MFGDCARWARYAVNRPRIILRKNGSCSRRRSIGNTWLKSRCLPTSKNATPPARMGLLVLASRQTRTARDGRQLTPPSCERQIINIISTSPRRRFSRVFRVIVSGSIVSSVRALMAINGRKRAAPRATGFLGITFLLQRQPVRTQQITILG